jgi:lipopolysaccharide biosynthesis regulator YciM
MEEYNLEGTSPLSTPIKAYYCYDCLKEMENIEERESRCKKCGAPGHLMLFKCPSCSNSIKAFHPDQRSEIHCFCNRA